MMHDYVGPLDIGSEVNLVHRYKLQSKPTLGVASSKTVAACLKKYESGCGVNTPCVHGEKCVFNTGAIPYSQKYICVPFMVDSELTVYRKTGVLPEGYASRPCYGDLWTSVAETVCMALINKKNEEIYNPVTYIFGVDGQFKNSARLQELSVGAIEPSINPSWNLLKQTQDGRIDISELLILKGQRVA